MSSNSWTRSTNAESVTNTNATRIRDFFKRTADSADLNESRKNKNKSKKTRREDQCANSISKDMSNDSNKILSWSTRQTISTISTMILTTLSNIAHFYRSSSRFLRLFSTISWSEKFSSARKSQSQVDWAKQMTVKMCLDTFLVSNRDFF